MTISESFQLLLSRIPLLTVVLLLPAPAACADDIPKLAQIKIAADAGDPVAQYQLAECYVMRIDSGQAELWYRKSAMQGYAPAQGKLGSHLLMRYRGGIGLSPEAISAAGKEALIWLDQGAAQGDTEAQGYLASAIMEGKLLNQDLVAAYKWGTLASRGSMLKIGTVFGRAARDSSILKMSAAQIAEAEKQVAAFTPRKLAPPPLPEQPLPAGLKLQGISGLATNRLAIISGKTFAAGDTATLKLSSKSLSITCIEVRESSALIKIEGDINQRELKMR